MSPDSAKRSAPDYIHRDRQKRARFEAEPEARNTENHYRPTSSSPPRGPAAHRAEQGRPRLNRSTTENVYDRRAEREEGRRQSHDFYRPSMNGTKENLSSGWNSHGFNYTKPNSEGDVGRRRSPSADNRSTTASRGSSPAVPKAAELAVSLSTTKKPTASSTAAADKEQRKDSIINAGLEFSAASAGELAVASTAEPELRTDTNPPLHPPPPSDQPMDEMASPEELVNAILEGLPLWIESSIAKTQAFDYRDNVKRISIQKSKFFEYDSASKQIHDRKLKDCDSECEQAEKTVRIYTNGVKDSLVKYFKVDTAKSKDDVEDNKKLKQTIEDLAARQKEHEELLKKKDQQISTLRDCVESQSRTVAVQSATLRSMSEKYNKLPDYSKLEQQMYDAKTDLAVLRKGQKATHEALQDLKIHTESSIECQIKDSAAMRAADLERHKKHSVDLEKHKIDLNAVCDIIKADVKKAREDIRQTEDVFMRTSFEQEQKMENWFEAQSVNDQTIKSKIEDIEEDVHSLQESGGISENSTRATSDKILGERVSELKAQLDTVQATLSGLQDLVETGLVDEETGTSNPSLVERQALIEQRLDHCEASATRNDSVTGQIEELKGELSEGLRLFQSEKTERYQDRVTAIQQQYDPQSLDRKIRSLQNGKVDSSSFQGLSIGLSNAFKDINELRTQPSQSAATVLTTTALVNLKTELQADWLQQHAVLRQELIAQIDTANSKLASMRKAVQNVDQRVDTINTTSLARQILDQLNPQVLAAREPMIQELRRNLMQMGNNVSSLQELFRQTTADVQRMQEEQVESKARIDAGTAGLSAAEVEAMLNAWSANIRPNILDEVGEQLYERVKVRMDPEIRAKLNALRIEIGQVLDEFSRVEDMTKLEDRMQDVEANIRPASSSLDLNTKVDRLRSKVDEMQANMLKSSIHAGEALNIRGQGGARGSSPEMVSRRSMQPPAPTQQLGGKLADRIAPRSNSPSAERRNGGGGGGGRRRTSESVSSPGRGIARKKRPPMSTVHID